MGDPQTEKSTGNRGVWIAFGALLTLGIALRLAGSVFSQGFVHPDEHQQYLEVAQGIVYGPHVRWWEYERGTRHYFYPYCLALLLTGLDALGVRDPIDQATAIRALLGIALFAGLALLARDWLRQGRVAGAFCLLAGAALSSDIVYMSVRTSSETAATIPLIFCLYLHKRDPFLTGLLLGIAFAIRFQMAFFIPGFIALSLYDDWSAQRGWKGSTGRMAAGLGLALIAAGLMDKVTWGEWFHSPLECFRANILEGIAAKYGVGPWYQYLVWGGELLAQAVPLLGLLFIALGARREKRAAFLGLLFLIGHSVIARKDQRFLWPLAPLLLVLFAAGFETSYRWLRDGWERRALIAALSCCLLGGCWFRFAELDWNPEPARASSQALAKLGKYHDLTGVLVFHLPSAECGNYFYLRRDVPLLVNDITDPSDPTIHALWKSGTINYLIAWPKDAARLTNYQLEEVDLVHGLGIFKINRQRAARP